jgi:hypothetical protein
MPKGVYPRGGTIEDRLWSRVFKTDGCWVWQGPPAAGGRYGRINYQGRDRVVHVVAWIITNGLMPIGLEIDHLCRNTMCVRPGHLEPVTHQENVRRGTWAGRRLTCVKHGPTTNTTSGYVCRPCHRESNRQYRRRHGAQPRYAA